MSPGIETMVGVVMTSVVVSADGDEMVFTAEDGHQWRFYHEQDCCENVRIEDICGDINDLVGSPLLQAEDVSNTSSPPDGDFDPAVDEWTFYKFATIKGSVTVRWFGSSEYYSTGVDLDVPAELRGEV